MNTENRVISSNLDMLVLKLISAQDLYGYMIRKTLSDHLGNLIEIKEGTLYPILHRLEDMGCLLQYESISPSGKTRKYYKLTDNGRDVLEDRQKEWRESAATIADIMKPIEFSENYTTAGSRPFLPFFHKCWNISKSA